MSLILNIDTAVETAYVTLSKDGAIIAQLVNTEQREHGAFLQPAIKNLLDKTSVSLQQVDAIALSSGPGSYTGLRVGMASAKGLCFALNKPLITIGTLEILASAAISSAHSESKNNNLLYCPMIDARRMEVFTALYDESMQSILNPCAMQLNADSFANWLLKNKILFFGTGAKKWKDICNNENAILVTEANNSLAMSILSHQKFELKNFANLPYAEPLYLKEFFDSSATK